MAPAKQQFWLFKTDPDSFSWADFKKAPGQTTFWDGVQNYQARNFLRDKVKIGDGILFYHSQVDPPFIAGTAKVVKEGYPDPSQFDAASKYFDADSSPENPRWYMVDIKLDQELKRPLSLDQLRNVPGLSNMELLKRGSRLSVQPVTASEWNLILKLGGVI